MRHPAAVEAFCSGILGHICFSAGSEWAASDRDWKRLFAVNLKQGHYVEAAWTANFRKLEQIADAPPGKWSDFKMVLLINTSPRRVATTSSTGIVGLQFRGSAACAADIK